MEADITGVHYSTCGAGPSDFVAPTCAEPLAQICAEEGSGGAGEHEGPSRRLSSRCQYSQSLSQQSLDACLVVARQVTHMLQRLLRLGFAKAHVAERRENLRVSVRHVRRRALTVRRSIGMPENQSNRRSSFHEQLTAVQGSVVGSANDGEVVGIIGTAFRAGNHMVHI